MFLCHWPEVEFDGYELLLYFFTTEWLVYSSGAVRSRSTVVQKGCRWTGIWVGELVDSNPLATECVQHMLPSLNTEFSIFSYLLKCCSKHLKSNTMFQPFFALPETFHKTRGWIFKTNLHFVVWPSLRFYWNFSSWSGTLISSRWFQIQLECNRCGSCAFYVSAI